mgnify:CR=1 FL=1
MVSFPQEERLHAGSVAGRRFTSPVTYKALCSCELYAISAAEFDSVRQLHPEVEGELAAATARWDGLGVKERLALACRTA